MSILTPCVGFPSSWVRSFRRSFLAMTWCLKRPRRKRLARLWTRPNRAVVDDEPSLIGLAKELLADLRYETLGFCSSKQALAAFKADTNHFNLLLTDEVTPQLTGTTLASAVRAIRPQRPVVMASGYGGPQLAAGRAASADICLLVAKPLVRAKLARAMRQRLRQEPAQGST